MADDPGKLFLKLFGHNNARQRVDFEARVKSGQITTRVVNRETGKEDTSATFFYYRVSLLDAENGEKVVTTFDLLPDKTKIRPTATSVGFELGVRSLLALKAVDHVVILTGAVQIVSGRATLIGLRAKFDARHDPLNPAFSNGAAIPISRLANAAATADVKQLTGSSFEKGTPWTDALKLGGELRNNSTFSITFQEYGPEGNRQILLTFGQSIPLKVADPKLDFRRRSFTVEREDTALPPVWDIIQRAPDLDDDDRVEDPDNRWLIQIVPSANNKGVPLLKLWNQWIAVPYLEGLKSAQAGSAFSLAPIFDHQDASPVLFLYEVRERINLLGSNPDQLTTEDFALPLDRGDSDTGRKVVARFHALLPGKRADEVIQALSHSLGTHDGAPLATAWRIRNPAGFDRLYDSLQAERLGPGFLLEGLHRFNPGKTQAVRFGSLDLGFPDPSEAGSGESLPEGKETVSLFRGDIAVLGPTGVKGDATFDARHVTIEARLRVLTAAPGGQDDVPGDEFLEDGERSDSPLIVPVGRFPQRAFFLEFHEQNSLEQSQTVNILLRDLAAQGGGVVAEGAQSVVVLDRHPFLVAKVNVPPLRAEEDNTEVANWSGGALDGPSWEMRVGDSFSLELPPQGVGEAMEKRTGPVDIKDGEPADFRFTPPARFQLEASFFAQRFADVPWNLRRHLGFPGQREPGAGIDSFRFEMLYGLQGEVETPFLRLAEISSRLGHVPGALPRELPWHATPEQSRAFDEFKKEWDGLRRSYRSRLAVLEPFDEQRVDEQTGEVVLDEKVRYKLRTNAELKFPILKKNGEVEPPDKATLPSSLQTLHFRDQTLKDGLAGGVSWPFESRNVYASSFRSSESTSGKLVRPYFSALGGWGFQKASFDKERTTVYSDTAMGRTFFISLERIGRIGVFWNLAKHVIVYERTVTPTKQFAGKQDPHKGRPLLRKVREYVEILQPTRHYPEFGAAPATRGFVTACTFKSRVIAVDSDWGSDVGDIGWQVSLWRPDEGRLNSSVYPKPQVVLEVAVDPDTGSAIEQYELEEPEKLVFYTDTREETDSRTDLWPAIEEIDYRDLPKPIPPDVAGHAGGNLDRPLPDAPAVEAGYDRFTLTVAPAAKPANLVVERAEEALSAALRNVTMMRSRARTIAGEVPEVVEKIARLTDPAEGFLQEVLARVPTGGQVTAALIDRLKQEVGKIGIGNLEQQLRTIKDRLPGEALPKAGQLCDRLVAESNAALDRLKAEVAALRQRARLEMRKALEPVEESKESARDEAKRFFDRPFDHFRQMLDAAEVELGALEEHNETFFSALGELESRVNAELDETLKRIENLNLQAGEDAARARDEVRRLRARLASLVREADSKLAGISDPRFGKIAAVVRKELPGIAARLDAVLAGVEKLLADASTTIDRVKTELKKIRTEIEEGRKAARKAIEDVQTEVDGLLANLRAAVGEVRKKVKALDERIEDEIDAYADTAGATLDELVQKIEQGFDDLQKQIEDEIDTAKTKAAAAIRSLCAKLFQALGDFLEELLLDVPKIQRQIQDALGQLAPGVSLDEVRRTIEREVDRLRSQLQGFADQVQREVIGPLAKQLGHGVFQMGDNVLRLLRAFGDAPIVPSLDFNRKQIAYFFDELKSTIDITPVTSLFNRIGDELKALGIRLPTRELGGRLLPDGLESFDLSKILPDFSGLKLDNLFPGLRMPAVARDKVKVTHGVDRQTRRAWAQADVDIPFEDSIDVFTTGAVSVRLLRSRFQAQARMEAGVDGSTDQTLKGNLSGNWQIAVADKPLVVFRDTALRFENGRVRFELSPEKIEFTEALRFLVDLLKTLEFKNDILTIEFLEENGIPVGVQSVLDLPLPDLSAGAFALSNLRLGSTFALTIKPGPGGVDFTLSTRLHLATKEAPFTLAISLLTGGGWLDTRALYKPRTGEVDALVSIGMVAGASLAFRFGPIHGGVWVLFGIEVEFRSNSRQGGSAFALMIFLLVRGQVQVLGFITVDLHLLLEARYEGSGRLIGSGRLSITIKMGWFFKITVSTSVRYVFKEGSGQRSLQSAQAASPGPQVRDAADLYIKMLV